MTDWNRLIFPFGKRKPSPRDRYASYNDRVFSSILDAVFVFLVLGPPLLWMQDQFYDLQTLDTILSTKPVDHDKLNDLLVTIALSSLLQVLVIGSALILCEYKLHTTPGRWILGLRLVDAKTEEYPTIFQLVRRFFGYFISLPPLMFGYIWINWDKKRQSWHDKAAGTVVLNDRPHGWYFGQVKKLYRKLCGKPEPETPPPVNDN